MRSARDVEGDRRPGADLRNLERQVAEANETTARLRTVLDEEREARRGVETELENLKKGSIAMMKYVSNLQRKKHDEELELLRDELLAQERVVEASLKDKRVAEKGPRAARGAQASLAAREQALQTQAWILEDRRRQVDEQFARLKEERELRRAEADWKFTSELNALPEMQKVIVEKDEELRRAHDALTIAEDENRRLRRFEALATARLGTSPTGDELRRLLSSWEQEIVRLRALANARNREVASLKEEFQAKLRNTVALQRIKYETEIEALKRERPGPRPRLGRRRK